MANFDSGAFIDLIAPTPLLMILAEHDEFIPVSVNRAHFERAGEPKQLFFYQGAMSHHMMILQLAKSQQVWRGIGL